MFVDDLRVQLINWRSEGIVMFCPILPDDSVNISREFRLFDKNADLRLSKKEFPGYQVELINLAGKEMDRTFDQWFDEMDGDKSGFLEPNEYGE